MKLVAMKKLPVQFTMTATELALARAADENSSDTKNQGIEPEKILVVKDTNFILYFFHFRLIHYFCVTFLFYFSGLFHK